jgi:hypothetical protein
MLHMSVDDRNEVDYVTPEIEDYKRRGLLSPTPASCLRQMKETNTTSSQADKTKYSPRLKLFHRAVVNSPINQFVCLQPAEYIL